MPVNKFMLIDKLNKMFLLIIVPLNTLWLKKLYSAASKKKQQEKDKFIIKDSKTVQLN